MTIQPPPPCPGCGALPGADHAEDCNVLSAMRAQAYPGIIGRNGREWYLNALDVRARRIAALEAALREIAEHSVSQPAALNMPEDAWERRLRRDFQRIASEALK